MRDDQGDIVIDEYLARLPDKGACLVNPAPVAYVDQRLTAALNKPYLQGTIGAVVECSSCTTVMLRPEFSWDVNTYYREMGFPFPYIDVTRKQMRLRFFELDGPNNERLTFILKQLLNPQVRYEYDCTLLGVPYLDSHVQAYLRHQAIREAHRRTAETGQEVSQQDVLQEWGLDYLPNQGEGGVEQDGQARYGENPERTSPQGTSDTPASSDPTPTVQWPWAYYVWRTRTDDTEKLAVWQQLLISALAARKVQTTFAVGFFGNQPHRFVLGDVDDRRVFFLHEDEEPTRELAALAVVQMLYDNHRHVTGATYGQLPQGRQAG